MSAANGFSLLVLAGTAGVVGYLIGSYRQWAHTYDEVWELRAAYTAAERAADEAIQRASHAERVLNALAREVAAQQQVEGFARAVFAQTEEERTIALHELEFLGNDPEDPQ